MQMTFSLAAAVMAFTASAAPSSKANKRDTIASGNNQNGSIFMFGNPAVARQLFWQSGACGLSTYFAGQVDPNIPLVAMPSGVFDQFGFAQHNTLCAKVITMTHQGVTRQAVVADRNLSVDNSIDMTLDLWEAFGGHDNDGTLIRGFSWSIGSGSSAPPPPPPPPPSTCSWEGHCLGAPCNDYNDCSDALVCTNGQCSN